MYQHVLTDQFLVVYCLYHYEQPKYDWYDADRFCLYMQSQLGEASRLLEFDDPAEFAFLRQASKRLVREQRQDIEAESHGNILLSATVFVGSRGTRNPHGGMIYGAV